LCTASATANTANQPTAKCSVSSTQTRQHVEAGDGKRH
jgi:hypothetical protein